MAKTNKNYDNLSQTYLFSEIAKRTKAFLEKNPGVTLLQLGIGNTTQPLTPTVIKGLKAGVDKLRDAATYTGYGDEQGDGRLRKALAGWYAKRETTLTPQEIFISDGAKPDSANIQSIFANNSVIAVEDPVYPVYLDTSIINGRRVVFMPCNNENGFVPSPPHDKVDIVYLCSPNNPTGVVMNNQQLTLFVDYAKKNNAVIIFDAAYSAFISDPNLPRSIYEIPDAKTCAIEINSFSKLAGFTGVRLGWTVVPDDLTVAVPSSNRHSGKRQRIQNHAGDSGQARMTAKGEIRSLWLRRQTTMFNGASNIAQEGGLAVLSDKGWQECMKLVKYYMENAKIIKHALVKLGLTVYGGNNAPYIWMKTTNGMTSWEFFDKLLAECRVVTTPGSGFGKHGEGYIRISAFGHREDIKKAVESIKEHLKL